MELGDATSTFVVRMWPEGSGTSEGPWRGSIDDVMRKRRIYFTNLGAMCEFIVEQRRQPAPAPQRGEDYP
jgi:hypothetical protein